MTGGLHLDLDLDMVSGLRYTHVLNLAKGSCPAHMVAACEN